MKKTIFLFAILLILGIIFGIKFEKSKAIGEACYTNVSLKVRGKSLEPVIREGETATLMKGYYRCYKINLNDIVAYNYSGNKNPVVKIVKALPGDVLSFKGCYLLRNGEIVTNSLGKPYCFKGSRKEMLMLYANRKLEGYLLLGNKIDGSLDSTVFGIVSKEDIIGKISR